MSENKNSTAYLASEIISWLSFPPLVGTVFFVFLVFWYANDFSQGLKWIVASSPFLVFVPLIFFALSLKLGWISDVDLSKRAERPAFLSVFVTSLAIATIILYLLHVPEKFIIYVLSGLIMTVITSLITFFWKISFHTATATSVLTAIVILGGLKFLPIFLAVPIIGWSRVVLKKHTFWQVVGGFVVAFVVTTTVFWIAGFKPGW